MNFLVIKYLKQGEAILTRSHRIMDDEMSLKMIFLTYQEDIIETLTGISHSTGDFISLVDKKCKIINGGNEITSETLYNELEYTMRDTDIGEVKLATIKITLNKE